MDLQIARRFGDFALDAALTVPEGSVTALFGRSGAGKSSLLGAVAGLVRPDSGFIRIGGRTVFNADTRVSLPPERRRLGVVFQDGRLFPHMTVRQNLLYGAGRDREVEAPRLDDVVEVLGLGSLLDRRPNSLSGGERQRVAIGRALLSKPDALLMDEPLAALDGARKAEILPMLSELRALRRIPILYVSHQMDEVVTLADRLALISEGRIVAEGPVEDVTSRLDLRPLTGRHEAGAVLRATVSGQDPEWGLTHLDIQGARLSVPKVDLPDGTGIRVRVRARDVALSLTPPQDASFLNVLAASIVEIAAADGPNLDVRLRLNGGNHLWARVTAKSADRLRLSPGLAVQALIKTVAIDRHSLAPR